MLRRAGTEKRRARVARARSPAAAIVLFATGCAVPVAAGLDEADANRVVVALEDNGVAAQKEVDAENEGRWSVSVARDDASAAVAVLTRESLPPPDAPGVLETLGKGSIVPSRAAEHAKLFAEARAKLPGDGSAWKPGLTASGKALALTFVPPTGEPRAATFFPESAGVVEAAAPQKLLRTKDGFSLEMTRAGDAQQTETVAGVLVVEAAGGPLVLRGAVLGSAGGRLVGLDGFSFEVRPEGHLLFYRNEDRPGVVAAVGAVLAAAGVNIAGMALGREERGGTALTVLTTDEPLTASVVAAVGAVEGVREVRPVTA